MGLGVVCLVTLVLFGSSWSGAAQAQAPAAQQAPPQRIQVTTTQLKPDMVAIWENLVRTELIPAQKKINLPWRHTFANGPFGNGFTRVAITPVVNYAQYDQPTPITRAVNAAAAAAYAAKINTTIQSQVTDILTLQTNNSIISGATAMQPFVVVTTYAVQSGRGPDFGTTLREDFLPAYRKAGVRDFWVYAPNFGTVPAGFRALVRPVAKFAELDDAALLQKGGLSQEQIAKVNARRDAVAAGTTQVVYRFIPELSYGMPATPRSTN
jgi:hypothetical protein